MVTVEGQYQSEGGQTGETLDLAGRTLPAEAGVDWLRGAWRLFLQAPGPWLLVTVVLLIVCGVVAVIPLAGMLVYLITPVLTAGLMIGSREVAAGRPLTLDHLFAGFSQQAGNLVLVGLIYLIGMASIAFLVGGLGIGLGLGGHLGLIGFVLLPVALVAVMMLVSAVWFAPALVVFHGVQPLAAMRASLLVTVKNWLPFLVYSVLLIPLTLLACVPFGLGLLVLTPMICASIYLGYRDIFIRG